MPDSTRRMVLRVRGSCGRRASKPIDDAELHEQVHGNIKTLDAPAMSYMVQLTVQHWEDWAVKAMIHRFRITLGLLRKELARRWQFDPNQLKLFEVGQRLKEGEEK